MVDGRPWAELRLMQDDLVLAEVAGATRLNTWWTLTPGEHHFWLEGRLAAGTEITRSAAALVVVEPFSLETAAEQAAKK